MTRWVPIGVFLILILLLTQILEQKAGPAIHTTTSPMVGKRVTLPALPPLGDAGDLQDAIEGEQPVLVNLFASWCTPCLAEHPILTELHKGGVTLYGIGWRDNPQAIQDWLNTHGNPFSAVWIDETGSVAIPLGLRGVPETYVFLRGKVVFHHAGVLTAQIVREQLLPLLEELL